MDKFTRFELKYKNDEYFNNKYVIEFWQHKKDESEEFEVNATSEHDTYEDALDSLKHGVEVYEDHGWGYSVVDHVKNKKTI